jgi:hypothetical protein
MQMQLRLIKQNGKMQAIYLTSHKHGVFLGEAGMEKLHLKLH